MEMSNERLNLDHTLQKLQKSNSSFYQHSSSKSSNKIGKLKHKVNKIFEEESTALQYNKTQNNRQQQPNISHFYPFLKSKSLQRIEIYNQVRDMAVSEFKLPQTKKVSKQKVRLTLLVQNLKTKENHMLKIQGLNEQTGKKIIEKIALVYND